MSDIEARRRHIQELREVRARREAAAAAAAAAPTPAAAVATVASLNPTVTPAAAVPTLSPSPRSQGPHQSLTVVKPVAEVVFPPEPPVVTFEKSCLTNHVYIYDEPQQPVAASAAERILSPRGSTTTSNPKLAPTTPMVRRERSSTLTTATSSSFAFPPRRGATVNAEILAKWERAENSSKALAESPAFLNFITKTCFVAERCLSTGRDVSLEEAVVGFAASANSNAASKTDLLSTRLRLTDPSVADRLVASISMQPSAGDLFAVAYGRSAVDAAASQTEGIVHVWSLRNSKTPALTLLADRDVSAVTFCDSQPAVLIGGSSTGRVQKWDMRVGQTPVAVSFPGADAHNASISALCNIPVAGARGQENEIVSTSTDGHLCVWDAENPLIPTCVGDYRAFVPTCVSVPSVDTPCFYIGATDGHVYTTTKVGMSRQEFAVLLPNSHHAAAVTSVDCHPPWQGNQTLSDVLLSSSLDWTCRIWYHPATSVGRSAAAWTSLPVQGADFVHDARWCPTNPAVFVCGEGNGNVTIFNAAKSLDVAASTLNVDKAGGSVCKVCWDATGQLVVAGTSRGEVVVCSVSQKLSQSAESDAGALVQLFA